MVRITRNLSSPSALALSGLLTLLFVGCFSDKQSLNSPSAAVGASGEEGTGLGPSVGGASAGVGAQAGKGAGTAGKGSVVGTGGSRPNEVGGSSGVGGSGARGGDGAVGNGGTLAGIGGIGGMNIAGAGFGGVAAGTTGGSAGSFAGDGTIAGAPNGGVPNGGTGGWVFNTSGSAGFCDSATGTGCDVHNDFCTDIKLDSCDPDTTGPCRGNCASPFAPSSCANGACPVGLECLPDQDEAFGSSCAGSDTPSCTSNGDCPEGFVCRGTSGAKRCAASAALCVGNAVDCPAVDPCPAGFTHALVDGCPGVCIAMAHCGCAANADCPYPSVCDRLARRCKIPAPAPGCAEPFFSDDCPGPGGTFVAYAVVAGFCNKVAYNGCQATDNLFATMEECLSTCEQRPFAYDCPAGRVAAYGCVECGGGGGCRLQGVMCLETCQADGDCSGAGFLCHDGLCQVYGCL